MSESIVIRHKQSGITLVELMIAMTLGLILTGGVITLFTFNRHSFDRDSMVMRMQDDARQAMREVVNDLSMAGYWADLVLPAAITPDASLAVATDCGPAGVPNWIYQIVTPGTGDHEAIVSVDNSTAATVTAAFSCLGAEVVPGTDVIAVKRLAGTRAPAVLATNTVYLRTNGTVGLLFREPANIPPAIPVPAPFTDWEYRPSIYYVRNFAINAGDGIPTLCRKVLQYGGMPTVVTECLAQGVEDFQVEFGLDTDGDGDPNVFVPNPTPIEMQTAVAAQLFVLARSIDMDRKYLNDKTYTISNAPAFQPNDNYYRRVYSVTIGLPNLRTLRVMGG